MKKNIQKKNIQGFTLIEVMVSVSIFTVIITTGIGALLNVTQSYNVAREKKAVADNLNFMMEGVTRELRLGSMYESGATNSGSDSFDPNPQNGKDDSIGFRVARGDDIRGQYMIYRLEDGVVRRYRYDTSNNLIAIDSLNDVNSVVIDEIDFTVVGTTSGSSDGQQPLVWIRIKAYPATDDSVELSLQTLVSQRVLDF